MPPTSLARRRRFVRETPAPFQLTARDIELVGLVARHRFLRSTHLSQLIEAPHKKLCDRLTGLFHAGYLDRPRAQLERFRDGGGSEPLVYALAGRGARLLTNHFGSGLPDVDWARKNDRAGRPFIRHTLAIADVHVAVVAAVRARPGITLLDRQALLAMAPAETRARAQPWLWHARLQHLDTRVELAIAPDHVFALQYPDGRFRAFLVECDRATMPVARAGLHRTSLQRKILAYTAAARAGEHTRQMGWKAFRVLVITTSRQRADHLLACIRDSVAEPARGLILVADTASLDGADIIAYPWRDARGAAHALI